MVFRRHLADLGLGIAEAMDTAQRGMGVDWASAQRLIEATLDEVGERTPVACGVATDQLPIGGADPSAVAEAYLEQLEFVEHRGGIGVVMCSRQLAASAASADDYLTAYRAVLDGARRPVILHWLGPAFDPALAGYWSPHSLEEAADTVIELCETGQVDGVKLSLLDADFEIAFRRRLPANVRLYTGDDFNYVELIAGDELGYSDALLGAFDPLAPIAARALAALRASDENGYRRLLEPTLPLARHLFEPPTQHYKTGVVWLAFLSGLQTHFRMIAGAESGRSAAHLRKAWRLAAEAGLFVDPERARGLAESYMRLHGLELDDECSHRHSTGGTGQRP